tara:strand:- start:31 stop:417 length:387 start_codon:yes stop_codon:yes gene_type:complete
MNWNPDELWVIATKVNDRFVACYGGSKLPVLTYQNESEAARDAIRAVRSLNRVRFPRDSPKWPDDYWVAKPLRECLLGNMKTSIVMPLGTEKGYVSYKICECGFPIDKNNEVFDTGFECLCDIKTEEE